MLYHSWGNHVNNFFSKSCFLKIKSVKAYTLFKREVKCKLSELTTQVLPRSEESHRGSSKTLWRGRQHTKLSTCLPLPLLNKRDLRGAQGSVPGSWSRKRPRPFPPCLT